MKAVMNRWMKVAMILALLGGSVLYGQTAEAAERYRIVPHEVAFDGIISEYLPLSDGYILAGRRRGGAEPDAALIVKLDHDGEEIWKWEYPGDSFPSIRYVRSTASGSYMFAGTSDNQFLYGEINSDGTAKWVRTSQSGAGVAVAIRETNDGGFLIVGEVRGGTGAPLNIAVVRMANENAVPDDTRIEKPGHQFVYDAIPSGDGGFVIVGTTQEPSGPSAPSAPTLAYVAKLNADGTLAWDKEMYVKREGTGDTPEYNSNTFQGIALRPDNAGYIISGNVSGGDFQHMQLASIDLDGNEQWHHVYPRDGVQVGLAAIPTRDSGYLAMGGNNASNGVLLKIAADGTRQWAKDLLNTGSLYAGRQLEDGSFIVAGSGRLYEVRVGPPTGLVQDDDRNTITGMDSTMEYSDDGGGSYTQYDPDNEPEFAGDVDVLVRYRQDWSAGHEAGEPASFRFTANPIEAVGELADIPVAYGTELADVGLPATVEVTLTGGDQETAAVTWDGGAPVYDPTAPGEYTFTGTIAPPDGATNPDGLTAAVKVIVSSLTGIEADRPSVQLLIGQSYSPVITAVYSDGSRTTVQDSLVFASSDSAVASVQTDGLVTAHSRGTATITAQYAGYEAAIQVEVSEAPPSNWSGSAPPNPNRTTVSCGAAACSASFGDEVRLDIPALENGGSFTITIEKIDAPSGSIPADWTLLSPVFELLKDGTGTVFAHPVTLRFKFDVTRLGELQKASLYYYDETEKIWVEIGSSVSGDTVIAQVDHFTKFAVLGAPQAAAAPEDPGTGTPRIKFTDTDGHWAELTIAEAAARRIVEGYEDGRFRPDQPVTRAQFITMLMRSLGIEEAPSESGLSFKDSGDVRPRAMPYVSAAARNGIIVGYADGTFRPDENITRAEMTVMILRAMHAQAEELPAPAFADAEEIPEWARSAAALAQRIGLIEGRDHNRFAPNAFTTRAEAVAVLLRMLEARG